MTQENITYVRPCLTAEQCVDTVRLLYGPTLADPISDELSRLNRMRHQAPHKITKRKELTPYGRRIDRRKARHQKRNFLHDSVEEYYNDLWETQLEIERDLDSNESLLMERFNSDYRDFFLENEHLLEEQEPGYYNSFDDYEYNDFDYDPWAHLRGLL